MVNGVLPPTAPLNETVPPVPALKVSIVAPFTALEKLMPAPAAVPPAFVLSKVGVFVIATGPVIVIMLPLVVILPPKLITVDPV